MVKFPLHFEVEAHSPAGIATSWSCKTNTHTPISCAIPTEFGGPGKCYSPEDFFGLSILNCIIATFKVYAERSKLHFTSCHGKALVTMDKDLSSNLLSISDIQIDLKIEGSSNREEAKRLLNTAIQHCPISNSIKSGKHFSIQVE